MSVTERLMAAGQWSVKLSPDTAKATTDLLDFFGHVSLFDGPMRPGLSDAVMLANARWTGVVRQRATPWDLAGANLISWLGDEDGKGAILEAKIGLAGVANTFATYVAAILAACPAVTAGTATAVGGTTDAEYQWIAPRAALANLCSILGAEFRVNKDATLDTAPLGSSVMFVQTPKAFALRRTSGRDINVVGIHTTQLDVSVDSEEHFVRALVKDKTGAWTGANGSATGYKDLHGNALKMSKAIDSSSLTPAGSAAALAAALVLAGQVLRQETSLGSDEYILPRDVAVGDWIGVYDPPSNLVDTTNPVHYRGEIIYPLKLRVLASTWPIERGMGVWYRDKAAVWTDLTPYVLFEQAGASLEVGAASRALLTTP